MNDIEGIELAQINLADKRNSVLQFIKDIDVQLGNANIVDSAGNRLSDVEYQKWRHVRLKERRRLENEAVGLKAQIHRLSVRKEAIKRQIQEKDKRVGIDEEVTRLRARVRELEKENSEINEKKLTLSRQLDATIRQLNAIPKEIR